MWLNFQCFGWSWYLSNDMQFYVIAPIVLIPWTLRSVISLPFSPLPPCSLSVCARVCVCELTLGITARFMLTWIPLKRTNMWRAATQSLCPFCWPEECLWYGYSPWIGVHSRNMWMHPKGYQHFKVTWLKRSLGGFSPKMDVPPIIILPQTWPCQGHSSCKCISFLSAIFVVVVL